MGAKGHRKGPRGEIQVAKLLADWWHQIEPDARFKRTPMSGGWGGEAEVRGEFKVSGDICTTSKLWPFTIEVKRREGWSFGSFAAGRKSPVWSWWRQCLDAAAEEGRTPLLWMRHNRRPWLVCGPERLLVPLLVRHGQTPDVVFRKLSPAVDDGDIRPCVVLGTKFLELPPQAFLTRAQRTRLRVP